MDPQGTSVQTSLANRWLSRTIPARSDPKFDVAIDDAVLIGYGIGGVSEGGMADQGNFGEGI